MATLPGYSINRAIADCPIAIPTEVYHRPPGGVLVHHRGELQVGPRIRLWCVCGFKWEGEGRRAAEKAWEEHLA